MSAAAGAPDPSEVPDVDASQPSTTLQIRLHDGRRVRAQLNMHHTVRHVQAIIARWVLYIALRRRFVICLLTGSRFSSGRCSVDAPDVGSRVGKGCNSLTIYLLVQCHALVQLSLVALIGRQHLRESYTFLHSLRVFRVFFGIQRGRWSCLLHTDGGLSPRTAHGRLANIGTSWIEGRCHNSKTCLISRSLFVIMHSCCDSFLSPFSSVSYEEEAFPFTLRNGGGTAVICGVCPPAS